MKNRINTEKMMHAGFEVSLLVKGIDGLLEVLGGLLFIFVSPIRLNKVVNLLTLHEISEDPRDLIANLLIKLSQSFSVSMQVFVVIYLMTHGLAKIIMVYLLQRKKRWAYPASVVFLLVFIAYQIYHCLYSHSLFMIALTVFDMVMIGLVLQEYKKID